MFLPTEFSLGPIGTSRESNKEESFHNGVHIEWTIVLVQRSHGNAVCQLSGASLCSTVIYLRE